MTITMDLVAWKLSDLNPSFGADAFRSFLLDGVLIYGEQTLLEEGYVYGCTSAQWEALSERMRQIHHFLVVDSTGLRQRQDDWPPSPMLLVDGGRLVDVINRVIHLTAELSRWDKACHQSMIDGCGLQEILGFLSDLMPYPAIVFDPSFRTIGHTTRHTVTVEAFDNAVQLGYTAPELMERIKRRRLMPRLDRTGQCLIEHAASNQRYFNAYRKHCKAGQVVAYSCIFFEDFQPSGGFVDLIECFFQNVDLYFMQTARQDQAGSYMYEYLVSDLIANRQSPQNRQLLDRLRYIDLPLTGAFFLIRLEPLQAGAVPMPYLCNLIAMSQPSIKPFLLQGAIFILLTSTGKSPERSYVDNFLNTLRLPLQNFTYRCFVSGGFTVLTGIYDAAIQCNAAREVSEKRLDTDDRAVYYEECWLQHCFLLLEGKLDLESVFGAPYRRVVACDAGSGSRYLSMLQTFLSCNCDYKETAARLGIHRNTAAYRIQKICSEAQIDPLDFHTRLSLALSFQMQEYLNGKT